MAADNKHASWVREYYAAAIVVKTSIGEVFYHYYGWLCKDRAYCEDDKCKKAIISAATVLVSLEENQKDRLFRLDRRIYVWENIIFIEPVFRRYLQTRDWVTEFPESDHEGMPSDYDLKYFGDEPPL